MNNERQTSAVGRTYKSPRKLLQTSRSPLQSKYNSYFALKELSVGNDQLFFLCRFSHIFDVSQQLMLTEELGEKQTSHNNVARHSGAFLKKNQLFTCITHWFWLEL